MSDHPNDQAVADRDDAPVTTSKSIKPERALLAEAVTINRRPQELYDFFRDQTNLAKVLENVEAIEKIDEKRSRWRVKAPGGQTVSWESVITHEVPGQELSWESAEGADVENSGKVEFKDAGARGTVVRATIAYEPPAGKIGQLVAKLFQREPRIQARRDLHRFKQFIECGEIATGARNQRERNKREENAS